jgi:hypothetical protein
LPFESQKNVVEVNFQMCKKENGAICTIKEETFPANKKLALVA